MKIIVNADDFGKSVEINRAINDSYKRGFVNSIGIIINAECVQNAVNQIDNGGGIGRMSIYILIFLPMRFPSLRQ